MDGAAKRFKARLGRWQRRMVERFASRVVHSLAWNKRMRRTMLRTIFEGYLPPDRVCLAQFDDHAFFVSPRDQTIGFELLSGKPWQRRELEAAIAILERAEALRPDGAFIDIGANIGTQTVYAMLTGKFACALAIEAASENFALLERNIAWNGLGDHVEAVRGAVLDGRREVALRLNRGNAGGHSVSAVHLRSPAGTEHVQGDTADAYLAAARGGWDDAALAWIDVEGLECDVLSGMAGALRLGIPIVFEYTPGAQAAAKWDAMRRLLQHAPYTHCARLQDGPDARVSTIAAMERPARQCDLIAWRAPPGENRVARAIGGT